jgi:hypothetical protein
MRKAATKRFKTGQRLNLEKNNNLEECWHLAGKTIINSFPTISIHWCKTLAFLTLGTILNVCVWLYEILLHV